MFELEDAAGFGKGLGDVGRSVIAHKLTALNALAIEPSHGPAREADSRGLLLVSENLDVGQPCGVVDGDIDPVVTDPTERPCCRLPVMRDLPCGSEPAS